MAQITRKKDTGEAGNGGHFGTVMRGESPVDVGLLAAEGDLSEDVTLSDDAQRVVSSVYAARDDQGFLYVEVKMDRRAMHYGTYQVSPADPADITDRDASDDEVDGAIEGMFDDPEDFANGAGWPGEASWDPESRTMTLYTDERSVSEASDEDLLNYGISDAVEHLDYGIIERISGR